MPDYIIPNLRNACRILRHLSKGDDSKGIGDLSRELSIPRTTVLRIVRTLEAENFLREDHGGLKLGGALAALGMKAAGSQDLREAAQPCLQSLTADTNESSHLAVWDDGRSLIAAVANCSHPLSAVSKEGTRAFVHASAGGKILLAYEVGGLLEDVWKKEDRVRLTERSLTTLADLRRELAYVRQVGFALDNEEYHEGVRCLAAPVIDSSGKVCAAVGITASTARFPEARIEQIAARVKQAAAAISRRIGFEPAPAAGA